MTSVDKSSILLIYTGGTIGMKTDPQTGSLTSFNFKDIYNEFPYLRKLPADIESVTISHIDSTNVTIELWQKLALLIRDNYHKFDGFVVLHGTDTMAYSASALSFMLENLAKPVVFTGSQLPIGVLRTDGRENLITAIDIAAAKRDGRAVVPEVCVYFQNKLFRGNRCKKRSVEQMNAFASENYPALAEVGVHINYNTASIAQVAEVEPLKVSTAMDPSVVFVKIYPGMTEQIFTAMLNIEGVKAIVLETFGAGNAPSFDWFVGAVKKVVDRGVIVVNVTQCIRGGVSMSLYNVGLCILKAGVVSCQDITVEAAVTKLMYLLGKGYSTQQVVEQLKVSIRGEISE